MPRLQFSKMTGAGNDFVLLDKKLNSDVEVTSELVRMLCDRRFGVGADGVLVIFDTGVYSFGMEYYNSDGSRGTLCGNGSRCAIRYAGLSGRMPAETESRFVCEGVEYSGIIGSDEVTFFLNEPTGFIEEEMVKIDDLEFNTGFIDTGSAHAIIDMKDNAEFADMYALESVPVFNLGGKIRHCNNFGDRGTNVNFVTIKNNVINIRTFERGVEDETLACGTGATAAAVVSALKKRVEPPVEVITRGGKLKINFELNDGKVKNLSLTGPAVRVFNGELEL